MTEPPTFTPSLSEFLAPSTCHKNINAPDHFQPGRPSGLTGSDNMSKMFVPGIPNGFPATAARSPVHKPLPSPPAYHGRVKSASQSYAKVRKQPLSDRSNIQQKQRTLKKSRSMENIHKEKAKDGLMASENQCDAPNPKLTALPRPPSAIKLPSLFRSTYSRDNERDTGSTASDEDQYSAKANSTAHSTQRHRGMEEKDTQKHRAVLDKFKEAITERWPSITSGGRRRQKRHTVVLGDAAKVASGIKVLGDIQGDVKRRMAEEQNLGSPKLQRMLDSPRKGTTSKDSSGWQQHIPSGLDDLRSLATSAKEIAGFDGLETDDPFCDTLEATFSTIPSDFLDFDFGLAELHGTAAPAQKQCDAFMDLVDLGQRSVPEGQNSELSGIGVYGVDQKSNQEKVSESLSSYNIKISGLYQHPNVMEFSSPLQKQIVATARSHLYTSALDRRRRNGVQLAQSPLKKVHTLSNASGHYEYVPDRALLPDGTRFIDITDSVSRASSDDELDKDIDLSLSQSKHTSDTSKRSIEEAGLPVNSLPFKKSKMQSLTRNSTSSVSLANDCSEDQPFTAENKAKYLDDATSETSAELDSAMIDSQSLSDEPIIQTAWAVRQPTASERRQSNASRGQLVSLRGGAQSITSTEYESSIQAEDVDELQLPDPRFMLRGT